MRFRALLVLGGSLLAVSLGCRPQQPGTVPQEISPAAGSEPGLSKRQEMAALAFIAYLGEQLKGSDDEVERQLAPCMESELAKQPLTRSRWSLAWGPAVYKFAFADLDDNMMYVVRDVNDPAHLAVVVRGTNAKAILDWIVEDFEVAGQVPWPYGNAPGQAKISKGTSDALKILQAMAPAGGPAPNQTLTRFLAAQAQTHPRLLVDVAGHSLGGLLSATLTLWLADTRSEWDPAGKATLAAHALAGPTAGNAAFAAYSDSRIGGITDRMHNPFDVAPLAWNYETMGTIASLYGEVAPPDELERGLLDVVRDLVKHKGYSQIKPAEPALSGALNTQATEFAAQGAWQHTCGYHCALGLTGSTFLPVTLNCQTGSEPPPPCPVCPEASQQH
jgi:triacylglycerol lipase